MNILDIIDLSHGCNRAKEKLGTKHRKTMFWILGGQIHSWIFFCLCRLRLSSHWWEICNGVPHLWGRMWSRLHLYPRWVAVQELWQPLQPLTVRRNNTFKCSFMFRCQSEGFFPSQNLKVKNLKVCPTIRYGFAQSRSLRAYWCMELCWCHLWHILFLSKYGLYNGFYFPYFI